MLKLFKEIFRTGDATVKYPFAPLEVAKDFRGKPEHVAENCIACAACTIACPPNAIRMETDLAAGTRTWSINYGRCVFCGRCEEVCPTEAIHLTPEFELAVGSKEDLMRRAVFTLADCEICGKPFAPAKEIAYAAEILAQTSDDPNRTEQQRRLLSTCPDCKRKADLQKLADMAIARQMETAK
ncbi:formate hydrogenlyase complex iron-sulfur subunit [Consotaella aegiceratis]|uniref:formate hydrogenlyase complex iron-sulfur subunit n=1 Tax=Consotaella aegiceratis TaxID=3097961 RepID=UPI002F3E319F